MGDEMEAGGDKMEQESKLEAFHSQSGFVGSRARGDTKALIPEERPLLPLV